MKQFTLDDRAYSEYLAWRKNHNCPIDACGAIGGKETFLFTPTSLGSCIVIKCACGAEIDLSHVEDW